MIQSDKQPMGIAWKRDEQNEKMMADFFCSLGKKAVSLSHYDLYDRSRLPLPGISIDMWKSFLMDPRVAEYINNEFEAIKSTELRKLIIDINNSKSVGQAQIINSLNKMLEDTTDKRNEGPAFVYCYVPLTADQMQAPNVKRLDSDPFLLTLD